MDAYPSLALLGPTTPTRTHAEAAGRWNALRSMRNFAQYLDVGEGGYRASWYTDAICDGLDLALLTATGRPGGIDCLEVYLPPRHGKTLHGAELLPPYAFAWASDLEIIYYTYSVTRARAAAKAVRQNLQSPKYRAISQARIGSAVSEVWDPERGAVVEHREEGEASANVLDVLREGAAPGTRKGKYLATSLGAAATGYGAHLSIYDDLVRNSADAESPARQALVQTELQTVAETRLYPNSAQVLITTRWAPGDPADFLHDRWVQQGKRILRLSFPAIREEDTEPEPETPEAFRDPRAVGEPLDPRRAHIYEAAKHSVAWPALFQQRPQLSGGCLFPASGWGRFDPSMFTERRRGGILDQIVLSVDPTFKAGGSSWAVIDVWAVVALPGERVGDPTRREGWKLAEVRGKWDWSEFRQTFYRVWQEWGALVRTILVEESANGHALLSDIRTTLADRGRPPSFRAEPIAVPARGSKHMRALLARPSYMAGLFRLPASSLGSITAGWVADHTDELAAFGVRRGPDDRVDTFVQFARWASEAAGVRPAYSIADADMSWATPRYGAL